jgi:hypothetical protein
VLQSGTRHQSLAKASPTIQRLTSFETK